MYRLLVGLFLITTIGCDQPERDPTFGLDASGSLNAVVYVDRNLNDGFDPGEDAPLVGVPVVLLRGSADTVMRRTSDTRGVATFNLVPVGTYRVAVISSSDSLVAGRIEPGELTIAANDTLDATVAFTYPVVTVADARQLPPGRRVQIRAVALNGGGTFADATVHIADSTGALRAFRVQPAAFAPGELVRWLGTTTVLDGQPALQDVSVSVMRFAAVPAPAPVTTVSAARADAGRLDAALVRIANASVLGWGMSAQGNLIVAVNDGSGRLELDVDRASGIDMSKLERGVLLDVTGVLVPNTTDNGDWQLKPRSNADIKLTVPAYTIEQLRNTDIGRRVRARGVALNAWSTFGDGSLHIKDATGSMRAVNVSPVSVFAGDTVEIIATVAADAGQSVLRDGTATVMATGAAAAPEVITMANLQTADQGRLDAALVRLPSAAVTDTATVGADYRLTLSAGSDTAVVVLDANGGFALGQYSIGARLEVTGVMLPDASGRIWLVKPRTKADILVRP